jgi:tetratricopeptide (TPR) repeat protein
MNRYAIKFTSDLALFLSRFNRSFRKPASAFLLVLSCGSPALLNAQVSPAIDQQFRQASEAMKQGNLQQAADGFAAIARNAPSFAEAYLNLGLVREEQGHHEEAVANFKKALQLKPHLRGANLFLGIAQYRSNQLDTAIASLRRETTAYPKDGRAREGELWRCCGCLGQSRKTRPKRCGYFVPSRPSSLVRLKGQLCAYVQGGSQILASAPDPGRSQCRRGTPHGCDR